MRSLEQSADITQDASFEVTSFLSQSMTRTSSATSRINHGRTQISSSAYCRGLAPHKNNYKHTHIYTLKPIGNYKRRSSAWRRTPPPYCQWPAPPPFLRIIGTASIPSISSRTRTRSELSIIYILVESLSQQLVCPATRTAHARIMAGSVYPHRMLAACLRYWSAYAASGYSENTLSIIPASAVDLRGRRVSLSEEVVACCCAMSRSPTLSITKDTSTLYVSETHAPPLGPLNEHKIQKHHRQSRTYKLKSLARNYRQIITYKLKYTSLTG